MLPRLRLDLRAHGSVFLSCLRQTRFPICLVDGVALTGCFKRLTRLFSFGQVALLATEETTKKPWRLGHEIVDSRSRLCNVRTFWVERRERSGQLERLKIDRPALIKPCRQNCGERRDGLSKLTIL